MKELIDKTAVVTEIKRLLAFYSKEIENNKKDPWAMDIAKRDILQEILSFLNTLEVKDVQEESVSKNLEEAAFDYAEACKYDGGEKLLCVEHFMEGAKWQYLAKHFYELGLKAKKGE